MGPLFFEDAVIQNQDTVRIPRIDNINLAAANDAIVIALCSADGIAKDNDERMMHCHNMLDRGVALGMESDDLWFDPLFLVVKGMQDKQMDVLNAIKAFSDEGLKSTAAFFWAQNTARCPRPSMCCWAWSACRSLPREADSPTC